MNNSQKYRTIIQYKQELAKEISELKDQCKALDEEINFFKSHAPYSIINALGDTAERFEFYTISDIIEEKYYHQKCVFSLLVLMEKRQTAI